MDVIGVIIWATLAISLIGVEICTVQMIAVWFAIASLVSFIAALFGVSLWVTITIFVVVSVALLLLTRPLVRKFMAEKKNPTNADAIIGQTGVVFEKIDNIVGAGRARFGGLDWTARSVDDNITFEVGERCIATDIEGVKVIVKPV